MQGQTENGGHHKKLILELLDYDQQNENSE